jgi:hypothetical protein
MRAALAFLNGAGSRRRRQSGDTDRGLLLLTDLLVNPGVTALNPGVTVLDPSGTGKRAGGTGERGTGGHGCARGGARPYPSAAALLKANIV